MEEQLGVASEPSAGGISDIALMGAATLGMSATALAVAALCLAVVHRDYFHRAKARTSHAGGHESELAHR
ncbi:MAG: hypothetical protein F2621_03530 [Actinobacteria bacterium]|uniref:Unannotated protein n=1 Tax=freshwater metagenome TaxID=449393 RepID=A0A6J6E9X3_9ZZZZ|nr:hypothetical protein [Actinomycetota bacterium]